MQEEVKAQIALRAHLCDKVTSGKYILGVLLWSVLSIHTYAQPTLPIPDHIVILILENHGYTQIIDAPSAPFINSLVNDPTTALFIESYGIEHPSQPNYLDLFSGSNQGVTNSNVPANHPFTTANLARQLMDAGKTFIMYSEDLPYVGYDGPGSGNYARKHNPVANWMGHGTNQVPETTNQPYSAFPSTDFSQLPTVCFVAPNQANDMHNGVDTARILVGDTWVHDNMDDYIQWAKTNNSLFILTFDEDERGQRNHILTLMTGPMVKPGQYDEVINHYSILRTIEDMYGLPYAGNASSVAPITDCWNSLNDINESGENIPGITIYPNPSDGSFSIESGTSGLEKNISIEIFDLSGRKVFEAPTTTSFPIKVDVQNIDAGIYFVRASSGGNLFIRKIIVQ